jgi:hypothetical protein
VEREVRSDPVDCGFHAAGDPEAKLETGSKEVVHWPAKVHGQSTGKEAGENLSNSDGADATIRLLESNKTGGSEEGGCTRGCRTREPKQKGRVKKGKVRKVAQERVTEVLWEPTRRTSCSGTGKSVESSGEGL